MLTIIFLICMIGIFGKLLGLALRMTWGIAKVVLTFVFLPIILIALLIGGFIYIAIPILAVIGIITLILSLATI